VRGAGGADCPGTQRSAPRRRPTAAGAGTPGPRRGGAGISPERRPGTCNGADLLFSLCCYYPVSDFLLWALGGGVRFGGCAFALVGFLSCVVDPGGLVCRFVRMVSVICAISWVSFGLVGARIRVSRLSNGSSSCGS